MADVASWDWWKTIFSFGGGGASDLDKWRRQGAILQPSSQPCPPGYYLYKYSGPNKNTAQCYVDHSYVAPPVAAPR